MKIHVTQEDIDKGRANSYQKCPVALAIKRQIPNNGVKVGIKHLRLYDKNDRAKEIECPRSVCLFVSKFDDRTKREEVKPFTFILKYEIPA